MWSLLEKADLGHWTTYIFLFGKMLLALARTVIHVFEGCRALDRFYSITTLGVG
jgi:hypothetical protein